MAHALLIGSPIQRPCLSFVTVAMIKYTDKSKFREKEFSLAYRSRYS